MIWSSLCRSNYLSPFSTLACSERGDKSGEVIMGFIEQMFFRCYKNLKAECLPEFFRRDEEERRRTLHCPKRRQRRRRRRWRSRESPSRRHSRPKGASRECRICRTALPRQPRAWWASVSAAEVVEGKRPSRRRKVSGLLEPDPKISGLARCRSAKESTSSVTDVQGPVL